MSNIPLLTKYVPYYRAVRSLSVKTSSLHLDSNQGRQIAGLNALPLSYRVRQVFTAYVRFCSECVATDLMIKLQAKLYMINVNFSQNDIEDAMNRQAQTMLQIQLNIDIIAVNTATQVPEFTTKATTEPYVSKKLV